MNGNRLHKAAFLFLFCIPTVLGSAQTPPRAVTEADILRGAYGPYRANNDLLS